MPYLKTPLSEPVDGLLADIAIRIQLSATDYRKAEERYETLSNWIDRPDNPLAGLVQLVYPQGSMAIGSTIASRLTTDEFDVDFIAQLDLLIGTSPKIVLDLLYESIRGEPGSRYYDMAERRTRCVTVDYADKMHADVTPMIRLPNTWERESHLFHNKPEDPQESDQTLVANPFGLAEWFKEKTPADEEFAKLFEKRASDYELLMADSEDLPDQEPVHRKSKAVITLQLMKRWRNLKYDKREGRRPPSVMMSKLIADAANNTDTLSEELLHQAKAMQAELNRWHRAGQLIRVANPVCPADVLTDRWPGSPDEQDIFIRDLDDLVVKVERLLAGCSLSDMQRIMADLFGEAPTGDAFEAYNQQVGTAIRDGKSQHTRDGGRLILPASGIVTGVKSPAAQPTPKNTFYGTERQEKQRRC